MHSILGNLATQTSSRVITGPIEDTSTCIVIESVPLWMVG